MKKLTKFLAIIGSITSLSVIPIISSKCNVSDNNKPNKEESNTKKDDDKDKNKIDKNKDPKNEGETNTPNKPSNTDNPNDAKPKDDGEIIPKEPNKPSDAEAPKEPEMPEMPKKPEKTENGDRENNNENEGSSNNEGTQPKDVMPNDESPKNENQPMNNGDSATPNSNSEQSTPKQKLEAIYKEFEKVKDIEKQLKDNDSILKFNSQFDTLYYNVMKNLNEDDKKYFEEVGFDDKSYIELWDLFELLSAIIHGNQNVEETKAKFIKSFKDIKSKIQKAYEMANKAK
ncbi:Mbov_0729 family lipopotein [Metamycoplasma auris]|uniref:Uncharacterized protein n=1 Tax=Metamycoplasma auris TaxID=51363 RepID=A0A2W7G3K9_9BACT|nr:variable surface lipoprotein [Metamycoplasma auris]PZW00544.1 hypothetical protein BCF89_1033 [Metamycoplasma auris]